MLRLVSRPALLACSALLAGVLLPVVPAAAEPVEDCAGFCVASATITPVGGSATPLADLGLNATVADGGDGTLGWSIDGWTGQPAAVIGGAVSLVIRTGEFVPRLTTAVAADLGVARSVDTSGAYTLTVTGQAAPVAWTTGPDAADCAAGLFCGDYDAMADDAGTGYRFSGETRDLDGESAEYVAGLDGAYLATNAQGLGEPFTYDPDEPGLGLGRFGNPQLDR